MGNCLGTRKKSDQGGYRLGSASQQQQTSPSQGHTLGGGGGGGSNSSASNNREAMLAAAEQRRLQSENRGTKPGGKLSKQLAEQKRQNPLQSTSEEMPERLVWD
ncbi:hypothetical protein VTP01DRAFT_5678 [Rhizomucor pusillus]|uniref:uncharacterized protein n=1 Tax=Rhizomucor pusillus TaxID=4840 RepID=UPI003743ACD7